MEMAFGKTAGCLILAGAAMVSAAQFPVRHEHWHDHCNGVLTVDGEGVAFHGPKKHVWTWKYRDIRQLTLAPDMVSVVTYEDAKLPLGAGREYRFTGAVPATELYALLKDRLDQRFVAALPEPASTPGWSFAVKLLGHKSAEGTLTIDSKGAIFSTSAKDASRTWRYRDIDNISSSGPFRLTITTFEQGSREFQFELKEAITEATYNAIWLQVQQSTGKIQNVGHALACPNSRGELGSPWASEKLTPRLSYFRRDCSARLSSAAPAKSPMACRATARFWYAGA
jgi:hypothetical protein